VVRNRERQRQLARARWERQQARRSADQQRNRRIAIVVGIVIALIAAAALIWLIVHIVGTEDTRKQEEQVPTGIPTPLQPTGTATQTVIIPPSATTPPPTTQGTTSGSRPPASRGSR
jgi:peptidyl-prolyl cis-trans isomerase B (cyclophilin B)